MHRLGSLITAVAVLLLAGCSAKPTVSENQCRAGDWQTIGYRDGAAGAQSTQLLAHQEACGAFGIVPTRDRYLAGWQEGLLAYCTADNGFHLGQRGGGLNSVCNASLREPFATAYQDGRQLYLARQEVKRLDRQINNHEARLDRLKQEIVGVSTAQLVPDLSVQERVSLLAKLESLVDEKAKINAELPQLHRALEDARYQLQRLDQTLARVIY